LEQVVAPLYLAAKYPAGATAMSVILIPSVLNAVAIQSDGKIIAAGSTLISDFKGYYDVWVFALTRYKTDGSLDASFGTGGRVVTWGFGVEGGPRALAIQSDGKIVAAGYKVVNSSDFLTARYNPNGTLDSSFGSGGLVTTSFGGIRDEAKDVAIQSDGKIVVAGQNRTFPTIPFTFNFALARYNTDGTLDTSFGSGGKVVTPFGYNFGSKAMAIQSDGYIVAVGEAGSDYTNIAFAWARYKADGSLDSNFGTDGKVLTPVDGVSGANTVAIQSDGKIIAAGHGGGYGTGSGIALAKYNSNGSLDSSFGTGGKVLTPFPLNGGAGANDIAIQSDSKIVVLGSRLISYPVHEHAMFRYLNNPHRPLFDF